MPKPPPTSGVTTRSLVPADLQESRRRARRRRPCAPWLPAYSVKRSLAASYSATAARGSIGVRRRSRLLTSSSVTLCAALANAARSAVGRRTASRAQRLSGDLVVEPPARRLARGLGVGDRRQRLAVDARSARPRPWPAASGLGDHHRDAVADVAHAVRARAPGAAALAPRAAVPVRERHGAGHVADAAPSRSAPVITASTPGAAWRPPCRSRGCGRGRGASARRSRRPDPAVSMSSV